MPAKSSSSNEVYWASTRQTGMSCGLNTDTESRPSVHSAALIESAIQTLKAVAQP